ncbi:MAG: leucine-rich repeat domain-containing protein [Simkania negevensis]|nr:leucine-rich repeat domain-containing protein [Simkania negevensis]
MQRTTACNRDTLLLTSTPISPSFPFWKLPIEIGALIAYMTGLELEKGFSSVSKKFCLFYKAGMARAGFGYVQMFTPVNSPQPPFATRMQSILKRVFQKPEIEQARLAIAKKKERLDRQQQFATSTLHPFSSYLNRPKNFLMWLFVGSTNNSLQILQGVYNERVYIETRKNILGELQYLGIKGLKEARLSEVLNSIEENHNQRLVSFFDCLVQRYPGTAVASLSQEMLIKAEDDLATKANIIRIWMESSEGKVFLKGITHLDLSSANLKALPPELSYFTSLQSLNLAQNELTLLPEGIGKLSGLRKLRLEGNKLTNLARSIRELTGLRLLSLTSSKMTRVLIGFRFWTVCYFFYSAVQLTMAVVQCTHPRLAGAIYTVQNLMMLLDGIVLYVGIVSLRAYEEPAGIQGKKKAFLTELDLTMLATIILAVGYFIYYDSCWVSYCKKNLSEIEFARVSIGECSLQNHLMMQLSYGWRFLLTLAFPTVPTNKNLLIDAALCNGATMLSLAYSKESYFREKIASLKL